MMISSIRKTDSREMEPERFVSQQQTIPKHSKFRPQGNPPSQQVLVVALTFESEEYEVYYKHEGTIREFLAYMSRLRNDRQLENCVCVNSHTTEIIALDVELAEFTERRLNLELVAGTQLLNAKWRKLRHNRYELEELLDDERAYWMTSLDVLREYR